MSLRVIDAASYQGNMPQKNMDFDDLIVKATEGCSYINPYCDSEAQEALSLGKSWEYIILPGTPMEIPQKLKHSFSLSIQEDILGKQSPSWTGKIKTLLMWHGP